MCIFCKIVNNEIPCYKIYEDSQTLAFLDASPATKGHTLIIPKTHYESIFDLPPEESNKILSVASIISNKYKKIFPEMQGINLISNSGEIAGQRVFHFHMHLVPRYSEEEMRIVRVSNPTAELESVHSLIKKSID